MIALALTAALITQAYSGQLDILRGLNDHECAEARCIALWGETCGVHEKARAARPIQCRDLPGSCEGFNIGGRSTYWHNGTVRPGDARPVLPTCKLNEVCVMSACLPNELCFSQGFGASPTVLEMHHPAADTKTAECVK